MAVETELHRIREIAADLEQGGPPVAVLDVEVVMIDGHRLPREIKDGCVATALAFVRFERSHLLLGDANIVVFPDGRAAAAIRRFAGVPNEPECRDVHHTFNGAQAVLAV
jgi:hypothetical protein